ncbi:unnamed protein product, partial [marine sediment metagenome]
MSFDEKNEMSLYLKNLERKRKLMKNVEYNDVFSVTVGKK